MKGRLLVALLGALLLVTPALAIETEGISTTDIGGSWEQLDPVAKAELAAEIAKRARAATAPPSPVTTVEQMEPFLVLIERLGSGLVKLAHDLGVEANELIKTPVGIIAMSLAAYYVMGADLIPPLLEILTGTLWFLLTTPLLLLLFFKSVVPVVKYAEVKKHRWVTRREYTAHKPIRREMVFGTEEGFNVDWVFAILLALNIVITLSIIC